VTVDGSGNVGAYTGRIHATQTNMLQAPTPASMAAPAPRPVAVGFPEPPDRV